MTDALGVAICAGLFVICLAIGRLVQWLCEAEDAPIHRGSYDPRGGQCERCGGRTAVQYGVSVWFASTLRDGEVTYDSEHTWCSHCREQIEAEIEAVVGESVEV